MKTCNSLYAIVEVDGNGDEKFFTGLLQAGDYNRNYKLNVYKNLKTAENRLKDIQNAYQGFIDGEPFRWRNYRLISELYIKEFKS